MSKAAASADGEDENITMNDFCKVKWNGSKTRIYFIHIIHKLFWWLSHFQLAIYSSLMSTLLLNIFGFSNFSRLITSQIFAKFLKWFSIFDAKSNQVCVKVTLSSKDWHFKEVNSDISWWHQRRKTSPYHHITYFPADLLMPAWSTLILLTHFLVLRKRVKS